jgi:hypothetical protein
LQAGADLYPTNPATEETNATADRFPESASPEATEKEDVDAWRDELSARLNRYRARRKVRPPRYPSLRLPFEGPALPTAASALSASSQRREFEPVSDHALALDGMRSVPSVTAKPKAAADVETQFLTAQAHGEQASLPRSSAAPGAAVHGGAKIIEFPGLAWGRHSWGPPALPSDQLAEPVSERPRILDVPEIAPPPPALGGITIDAVEPPEAERRPGIDIPLQSAALSLRFLAALVDGTIIAMAAALFGFIFWKVTAVRPPLFQILGLAGGVVCVFWAAYQYLLIVYAGNTPGLRVAGLELTRFDGTATGRSLRRWRMLASYLSAASLGMGYAWLFLDEDSLCWHDRITHTYLAPKKGSTAASGPSFD